MANGLFTITEIFNRVERLEELINTNSVSQEIVIEVNEIKEEVNQLQTEVEVLKNSATGGSGGSGAGTGIIEW